MAPLQFLGAAKFAEQIFLGDPIENSNQRMRIRGKALENFFPKLQQSVGFVVAAVEEFSRLLEIDKKQFDGISGFTVAKNNVPGWGEVAGKCAQCGHGVVQSNLRQFVRIEEIEHQP